MNGRRPLSIHDTLLTLPLFQGIGQTELQQIVGHTRLEFTHLESRQPIVTAGEPCSALTYVLNGRVTVVAHADDHSYSVEETLNAPTLIQPEHLFGLTQRHTRDVTADVPSDLLSISKSETLRLLHEHDIFRTNLLNILSTMAQRQARRPWHTPPRSIRDKICLFVTERCLYPAGDKTIHIRMQQLAALIGESRLNLSRELHRMEQEGRATLWREHIQLHAIELLFSQ